MERAINAALFDAEIERYPWRNVIPHATKLIASSPFSLRSDNAPSFFINRDPSSQYYGCWSDKGAIDPDWQSGGPIRLYAFLRNITNAEACEILYEVPDAYARPELRINLRGTGPPAKRRPVDITAYIAQEIAGAGIPYLTGRGIAPIIQRLYRCGFDNAKNAVVMPWAGPNGDVMNAKWRATWGKAFWYARGGSPVKSMIYGIDIAYRRKIKRAAIVEAEIDAMTAASAGTFGLAVGGSEFTDEKAELLRRSPIEELLIAGDNDEAGEKLRWEITRKMRGYVRLYNVEISGGKDFNAVGIEGTRLACESAKRIDTVRPRLLIR
ncbi:DNA primase [Paenibacillus sp. FSL R7-269]|uniref:toprim domain-containing protein n=1 Tax=Paenibacillus sp. FSL R7-269 TaxID=1226755 RepID=UPI0003E24877|nr:toprim domain-containing protein [Paenibacillus sp. FSL R7-269]ETT40930.1 DNA primase [Paenibacillus sp. FSL R7-269]